MRIINEINVGDYWVVLNGRILEVGMPGTNCDVLLSMKRSAIYTIDEVAYGRWPIIQFTNERDYQAVIHKGFKVRIFDVVSRMSEFKHFEIISKLKHPGREFLVDEFAPDGIKIYSTSEKYDEQEESNK
jgi:hypothetical protein